MGYLFLVISSLAAATKGYCGKKTSGYVSDMKDSVLANAVRMVLCIFIGFALTTAQQGLSAFRMNGASFLAAALSGVFSTAFIVTWMLAVKRGAIMMLSVFTIMGVIVPVVGSSVVFGETITTVQWLGLALLLVAVFLMCSYNSSLQKKLSLSSLILLILCGASSGLTEFSQKLFVGNANGASVAAFNFYTYLISAAILGVLTVVMNRNTSAVDSVRKLKPMFGYILVMAASLFANSYFKTLAAKTVPSAQLYPLTQGIGMILSAAMAAVFFQERLTKKCVVGMVLSFAALMMINLIK